MTKGHIALGTTVAELREYMLVDVRQYLRTNANQMAAKLGQGAGDYGDLELWTAWLMDDWQAGVGKSDAEGGGFLYAETETRWPGRITLPGALIPAIPQDDTNYPLNFESTAGQIKPESSLDIGTGETVVRFAKAITGNGTPLIGVHFATTPNPSVLSGDPILFKVELWSSTGSPAVPNALIESYEDIDDGIYTHFAPFTTTLTDTVTYHIVWYPSTAGQTLTLPIDTSSDDAAGDLVSTYNGSTWTGAYTGGRPLMTPVMGMPDDSVTKIVYFPAADKMYAAAGAKLFRQTDDTTSWTSIKTFGASITDLFVLGSTLYCGLGDATNYQTMNSSETFSATPAVPGRLFTYWGGYIWRAVANAVYYSSDGSTWSSALTMCPTGFLVNGMAGHNDNMYVATDDALRYVTYGDLVIEQTPWNMIDTAEETGKNMLSYQGALIIPQGQSITRFDSGAMLPIGPDLGEGLPIFQAGDVQDLAAQNNWLFCLVLGEAGQSTVWAYNGQGWHNVAVSPAADIHYFTCMHYRRDTRRLYIGTNDGAIYHVTVPDTPSISDENAFTWTSGYGWLETDWFFGGLHDVQKDFESVYISADYCDSDNPIKVYWQDDASTGWEYLGQVTSEREELRWSDYTTRPNSRQVKIGLGIYSRQSIFNDGGPEVRAVRVKFHNMTSDVYRWSLPLQISDDQTTLDNAMNPYSASAQRAHVDLMATQIPPIIYRDIDGNSYETKVLDVAFQVDKLEYLNAGNSYSGVARVTLEQVTPGTL